MWKTASVLALGIVDRYGPKWQSSSEVVFGSQAMTRYDCGSFRRNEGKRQRLERPTMCDDGTMTKILWLSGSKLSG